MSCLGTTDDLHKGKNMSNRLFCFIKVTFNRKGFVMGKLNGVYQHVLNKSRLNDLKSQTSWETSGGETLPLP